MPEYSQCFVCSPPKTENVNVKVAQSCLTLWNSPGQNTGVGSLSLLQGIFPTQGLNPGLLHCRQILYQLSHKGSPRMLVWGAYSFSIRSSRPRNQTRVSCIAGGFLTNELWGKPKKLEIWLPKNDWTSKLWNIHIFKDYLAMKRNKLLTCSVTWKNLTVTMMSERRPIK